MCSGRIDMAHVLRAFSNGVDGVFIGGCHLNECNYITHGNYHALNMVLLFKRIMEHIGLNKERLAIQFMSGAEATLFTESVNDFVKKVKDIGPIGESEGMGRDELTSRLAEITKLVPYIRLVERERLRIPVNSKEEYQKFFTSGEFNKLFNELLIVTLLTTQRLNPRSLPLFESVD